MKESSEANQSTRWLTRGFGVIGLAWLLTFLVVAFGPWKVEDAGPFGDAFGLLNTLFSGAAFALLIYAALMQKEELELQRDELQLMRQESAAQTELFKRQTEIQQKQLEAFESQIRAAAARERQASLPITWLSAVNQSDHLRTDVRFVNRGAAVFDVRIAIDPHAELTSRRQRDVWTPNEVLQVDIHNQGNRDTVAIWVLYGTITGEEFFDHFQMRRFGSQFLVERVGRRSQPRVDLSAQIIVQAHSSP